jgi:hypothetical protein
VKYHDVIERRVRYIKIVCAAFDEKSVRMVERRRNFATGFLAGEFSSEDVDSISPI